jgi:hypothetical protein
MVADNPVARSLFQRGCRIAFRDDQKTAVVLTLEAGGQLGLQQHWADDAALQTVDCALEFTPEALQSVASGGACMDPPSVSGRDVALGQQVLLVLGIELGDRDSDRTGPVGDGPQLALTRSMVLDAQLAPERQAYSVFTAHDPGPYDCRHWQIEAGVTPQGLHFAVSVGLTDPQTPLRAHSDPRRLSGLGHELVLLTDAQGAQAGWHIGIVAAILQEYARTEKPFTAPDWIDYQRPLVSGGTTEGFLVVESTQLESPFALAGETWGRFYMLIGVTRPELDILNTQREPLRVFQMLRSELGQAEITDCFRRPIPLW